MFNHLSGDDAIELALGCHLLDSSGVDAIGNSGSSGCSLCGKIRSGTIFEKFPCFIQEISVTASDLEQLTADKTALLHIL